MKILLVDDDNGVLQALLRILQTFPANDVRIAASGTEALESAMSQGAPDVLITDVIMEPMNGLTLCNKMSNRFPGTKTIFITGYDLSEYSEYTQGHPVLIKPVSAKELLRAIESVIEPLPAAPVPVVEETPVAEVNPATPVPVEAQPAAAASAAPAPVPTVEESKATKQTELLLQAPVVAGPAVVPEATPTPTPVPTATPQAVPVVRATPAPTAAPTAKPQAVPVAKATPVPTAAPTATPQAVPVARATPVPTAAPTATPQAVPVAKATPVPTAAPTATPQAVPVAKATPAPTTAPTATPQAVPVARPTPVPTAAPTVKPQAVPIPKATPQATPVSTVAATPKATPKPVDGIIGSTIGTYKIVRALGKGKWGRVFEAIQTSMNRTVALELLSPELASDPAAKAQFIADASAKANIQHPQILSVYEAGEAGGHSYFTREYVEGENFARFVELGKTIDEPVALKTVKVIAEALAYLSQKQIAHIMLEASSIYLGTDNRPRLANLATNDNDQPAVQAEIRALGQAVSAALPGGRATSPGLAGMFIRMKTGGQNGFLSWASLLQAVAALEPKVVPADAFKLSAQDVAAIQAVESVRKKQKRQLILSIAGAVALVCISGVVMWRFFGSNEKNLDTMVKIPAGEFTYQDGKKVNLPTFWIDQYEVTIGQYARFLDYLDSHKDEKYKFDHPDQPKGKSHKPLNWDIYLGRAKWAKPVKFIPIDLNCPQFLVDWWDAYAYANWKGRRLPTEQEWEKAARGTDGRLYPWGSEFDPKKCNSNLDYIERPGPETIGRVDGYFAWCPVDAIPADKSPYGVIGMAGNVSEWTGTLVNTPDGKVPVIRGGNYHSPENRVTRRITEFDHEATNEYLGFRTASDAAPK